MITPAQVAEVLAVASEIDGREVTMPMAQVWALALQHGQITHEEAMAAVPMFYADPDTGTRWIRPADIVRITQAIRIEDAQSRRRLEQQARHKLPPAGTPGGPPAQPPLRDRREDLHALLSSVRVTSTGHQRWPLTGDPDMRRAQTTSPSPEARAAADKASRLKALAIVAESRARTQAHPQPDNTPER